MKISIIRMLHEYDVYFALSQYCQSTAIDLREVVLITEVSFIVKYTLLLCTYKTVSKEPGFSHSFSLTYRERSLTKKLGSSEVLFAYSISSQMPNDLLDGKKI